MRYFVWLTGIVCILQADPLLRLQYTGVYVLGEDNRTIHIERHEPVVCMEIGITPQNLYGKEMRKIPSVCTHRVMTTLGTIQPMQIDPMIQTVGELEVLDFIRKQTKNPAKYLLIDSRRSDWYQQLTIPTAVNIPYDEILYDADFPKEHQRLMHLLNIGKKGQVYDFSHAKEILLFCNGAWCVQSVRAIKALMNMGYPKSKIRWYRGGLQDWLSMGFRGVKASENR